MRGEGPRKSTCHRARMTSRAWARAPRRDDASSRSLPAGHQATAVGSGLSFTDTANSVVTCASLTNGTTNTYAEALAGGPTVAHTTDSSGTQAPPNFGSCTATVGGLHPSASASCSTSWALTATSTTNVNVSNIVCTILVSGGAPFGCTIAWEAHPAR